MATIRAAADPQQWSFLFCDLIGYESHNESNPRLVRSVRVRSVNEGALMQRHLAWLQDDIHRARFIYSHNLLTSHQKIQIVANIRMAQYALPVRSRNGPHAAVFSITGRERDPR